MSLRGRWRLLRLRLGTPALVVVAAAALLCMVGLVVSSSVDAAADRPPTLALQQGLRLLVALPVCAVAFFLRPRFVRANAYAFYALCLALLVAVLFVGPVINGARRWLVLTSALRFQPSDFAKLAVCLALARFCSIRSRVESLRGVCVALAIAAVPALLVLKEPDLGTALNILPIALVVLLAAGMRRSHLAIVIALLLAAVAAYAIFGLHGYQRERVETWIKQDSLTPAEKQGQGYHLHRSKLAIGSGGLTGYGWSEGPQNQRDLLPERHTDFAFSVIAEEWGFLGALLVLALQLTLPAGLLLLSLRVREPFARLGVVAIAAQVGFQAFVNIGVAMGALPTTGIALPLVSYGGSSAVVTLTSLALALDLAAHAEPVLSGDSFEPEEEETLLDRTLPGGRGSDARTSRRLAASR